MVVGVNCGHTIEGVGCGAVGLFHESDYTRKVGYALMEILKNSGVSVIDRSEEHTSELQSQR